jgi:hypothetical protein
MSNLTDQEKLMFIPNIIEQFRNGNISLDEMWKQINQELTCHQYANICVGSVTSCMCQNLQHH